MTERAIRGFHRDEVGDWVADLACGHGQHVRHRPPFELRPWVTTETGRASMLGVMLDCVYCDMPALPPDVEVYRTTDGFTQDTVPAGLLKDHRTKPGVWGRIVVSHGTLGYSTAEPKPGHWVLRPGVVGIIVPDCYHHVSIIGPVAFHVEFCRVPRRHESETPQ